MTALARIDGLHISFGGVAAANGVSFEVNQAEFLAVIGPNGAGKTTALRMVAGLLRPDSGRVFFDGRDVTGLAAHARVRLGLGFTHQIVRPFYSFTTIENVMLAAATPPKLTCRSSMRASAVMPAAAARGPRARPD